MTGNATGEVTAKENGVAMDQAIVKTTDKASVTMAIVDGEGDNVSHETPRFMAIKH